MTLPSTIVNPVTGDRIEFLNSPLLGDGDLLRFRCVLAPHAKGSPRHSHATFDETFEVEAGALEMLLYGGTSRTLETGEAIAVPKRMIHGFRNPTATPVTFVSTATPGDGVERFLRLMTGLAAEGRTTADGMPRDPRAMALALQHADLLLAGAPHTPQRAVLGALAGMAALTGFDRQLHRFWSADTAVAR